MKFFCINCKLEFEEDNPSKKDYKDYLLGSCWKYISNCPSCGQESDEKRIPKLQKPSKYLPSQSTTCNGNCGSCNI